jgi:hypothetical protein
MGVIFCWMLGFFAEELPVRGGDDLVDASVAIVLSEAALALKKSSPQLATRFRSADAHSYTAKSG